MGLLRALGLGKDPHIEWMIEAFRAEPREIVLNRLYEGTPKHQLWRGEAHGQALTFYTDAGNKFRGGGGVYLGNAGPQFMDGISEYRCYFWRPKAPSRISIDEPRWATVVEKATGDPEWTSSFPEEAFEDGVAVGPFAMELDCPLDARPVFPRLTDLRAQLVKLSDAVERVYLYESGIGIGFAVDRLSREKLVADVETGCQILRLNAAIG
jgi:hypothetical protein